MQVKEINRPRRLNLERFLRVSHDSDLIFVSTHWFLCIWLLSPCLTSLSTSELAPTPTYTPRQARTRRCTRKQTEPATCTFTRAKKTQHTPKHTCQRQLSPGDTPRESCSYCQHTGWELCHSTLDITVTSSSALFPNHCSCSANGQIWLWHTEHRTRLDM